MVTYLSHAQSVEKATDQLNICADRLSQLTESEEKLIKKIAVALLEVLQNFC